MDFSKFKTSDWLKVGGAAGFLIFGLFLDWAKLGGYGGGNAFDFFFRGTIPWLLIVAVGVISFLLAGGVIKKSPVPWPLVLLAAAGLATFLNLLLVIMGPEEDTGFGTVEFDRGIGLWLSFVSAVVCLVGCFLGFQESGGNLKDLTDMNKMKGAFGQGGSTPPPPPPPGAGAPPPPPPPAG